ncbi:MAG: hydantoinase/oxoprolinase family protein, partial [Alphaproteobacteria bacterium]
MSSILAVDIGGTFTDLVAYDLATGSVSYSKSPTTYEDLVEGIFECVAKAGVDLRDAELVKHGTTLVINALLQRNGAKTALITTKGFRDVLEIGRGNRPTPFNLRYRRDEPLVPRALRFEVEERIGGKGEELAPLDIDGIDALAENFRELGIEAVAVSLLNAYANPAHEEQAASRLREKMPDAYITAGAALSREWFEYERTATAVANAFVGPQLSGYIGRFDEALRKSGLDGPLFMMGSNGGVLSAERAREQPVQLVESGPVGGCIGAAAYAGALGLDNAIAFDMGGTTAKCALVTDGRFTVDSINYVGGFETGFPVRGAVIDILEVGAGGGSIAWLDDQQRLHVGPRSAGSMPGPVAYGNGGAEPTVTDANLVLGRIDPARFLGGEMELDVKGAHGAIRARIAEPLGYGDEDGTLRMADGIIAIAVIKMAGAIKKITIERGLDPRDFALICYGGGGPLHAASLARELHIPLVVVPPEPGNFSATGMLLADARLDDSRTFLRALSDESIAESETLFSAMEAAAAAELGGEDGTGDIRFDRVAEMRYRGQKHSIRLAISGLNDVAAVRARFENDYRRRYGHADSNAPTEYVGLHLG